MVPGCSDLLITISTGLMAVKKVGRPSRRQGQLIMTRDDLQLLTSWLMQLFKRQNSLERHLVEKLSVLVKYLFFVSSLYSTERIVESAVISAFIVTNVTQIWEKMFLATHLVEPEHKISFMSSVFFVGGFFASACAKLQLLCMYLQGLAFKSGHRQTKS